MQSRSSNMGAAPKTNEPAEQQIPRRTLLAWLSGVGIVGSALAGVFSTFVFIKPRATYGQPNRFQIGKPGRLPSRRAHRHRQQARLHRARGQQAGRHLHHLHAPGLHRGAIADTGFACPCHGSRYDQDGNVTGGPAPKPLPWFQVTPGAQRRAGSGQETTRSTPELT